MKNQLLLTVILASGLLGCTHNINMVSLDPAINGSATPSDITILFTAELESYVYTDGNGLDNYQFLIGPVLKETVIKGFDQKFGNVIVVADDSAMENINTSGLTLAISSIDLKRGALTFMASEATVSLDAKFSPIGALNYLNLSTSESAIVSPGAAGAFSGAGGNNNAYNSAMGASMQLAISKAVAGLVEQAVLLANN